MYRLTGPMASRLGTRFGNNYVCIIGAIISSIGLLAASFVNSIPLLIVSYSIVTGLGFGLMYIPSVIACVPYFTKRRSLAIGICLCGSGFGTFALAPVTHVILKTWGWRWVMRTLSALSFVGVLCGATMLPVLVSDDKKSTNRCRYTSFSEEFDRRTRRSSGFLKMISFVIGEDLMDSKRLGNYFLFVLTDFLTFASVYIPYTHLPSFAEVRQELLRGLCKRFDKLQKHFSLNFCLTLPDLYSTFKTPGRNLH